MKLLIIAFLLSVFLIPVGGCATDAQTGALIGAGAGGLLGYVIGNERDKSRHYHHGHYKRGHHNKRRHHHY
tara:strand:+ start:1263 stop:1475 length:213 start_codon:yes stop_codon:yes gene_type:complete